MMRAMKNPTLSMALAACLMAAVSAQAADKPKEASFGKGTGAMLTKEQLRTCMNQKTHLGELDAELLKEQAALGTLKDDVTREGDALKAKIDTVDRTKPEAVAAFNEQAQAHDKQIDAYQTRVSAFNARVAEANTERDAHAKGCENRRYLEDDEIAIKKGK